MLIKEAVESYGLTLFCGSLDREIASVYCCDLLSNALVKLKEKSAWLTVMNNVNVGAVAYNNNAACVVLTEGTVPDEELLKSAKTHGVTVLGSKEDSYKTAVNLSRGIKG